MIENRKLCGDKQLPRADQKSFSLLYLTIGVEGRQILNIKNPHIMVDTLSKAKFWKMAGDPFIRPQNIAFERHVFLITKQLPGKTVKHFYSTLNELAQNCYFEKNVRDAIQRCLKHSLMSFKKKTSCRKKRWNWGTLSSWQLTWISGVKISIKRKLKTSLLSRQALAQHIYSSSTHSSIWSLTDIFPRQRPWPPPFQCPNCGVLGVTNHRQFSTTRRNL